MNSAKFPIGWNQYGATEKAIDGNRAGPTDDARKLAITVNGLEFHVGRQKGTQGALSCERKALAPSAVRFVPTGIVSASKRNALRTSGSAYPASLEPRKKKRTDPAGSLPSVLKTETLIFQARGNSA